MDFFRLKKPARLLGLLMVLFALVVGGCGGGGESSSDPIVGTLNIANSTGQAINNAYISPASSSAWGPDQLASSISDGTSRYIDNIPAGSYDVKVVLADGSINYQYGKGVLAGVTTTITFSPPSPQPTTGTIRITNSTGQAINNAYISPSSSSTWGQDQLASSISNGISRDIINIPPGSYDVKVVTADGSTGYYYGATVSAGATFTVNFTPPEPITGAIKIANSTGQTINYAYISPASSSTWGPDQLGANTIASGSSFTITAIPSDSYDVKVVLADGSIKYKYGVSVLAGATTTVTFIQDNGTIRIANSSGQAIDYAYISPASSTSWGVNQLSSSISNGNSRDITNIPPGSYDIKVVLADGSIKYQYGVAVLAGGINTVTVIPTPTGSIKIVNSTNQTIYNVYISPASSSTWGSDQLGSSTIANGSSFTVSNIPTGSYDIKVVTANGSTGYVYGATVTAGGVFTATFYPTGTLPGTLKINNLSGQTINYLYVTSTSSSTWGTDQLGDLTIPNGYYFTLTNITPGSYDLMAVLADGTARYLYDFTISSGATFTVNVNY